MAKHSYRQEAHHPINRAQRRRYSPKLCPHFKFWQPLELSISSNTATFNIQWLNQLTSSHTHYYSFSDAQKPSGTPVCTHTPASCLPVFSVLPTQTVGVCCSCGSSTLPTQNQAPEASSDLVPAHRQPASGVIHTAPQGFQLLTVERYKRFGKFYETSQYFHKMHNRSKKVCFTITIIFMYFLRWSYSSSVTPLEGRIGSDKIVSSNCLTGHDGDNYDAAAESQFGRSPQHRCCTTFIIFNAREENISVTSFTVTAQTIFAICAFFPLSIPLVPQSKSILTCLIY